LENSGSRGGDLKGGEGYIVFWVLGLGGYLRMSFVYVLVTYPGGHPYCDKDLFVGSLELLIRDCCNGEYGSFYGGRELRGDCLVSYHFVLEVSQKHASKALCERVMRTISCIAVDMVVRPLGRRGYLDDWLMFVEKGGDVFGTRFLEELVRVDTVVRREEFLGIAWNCW
jgi:hypothetical protein